jgi:hypothetical protein
VTHFATYNDAGEIAFRVDLVGKADGGVPTPHIQYPIWNVDQKTGAKYLNKWGPAQPWQP